jgi:hypothetical protein
MCKKKKYQGYHTLLSLQLSTEGTYGEDVRVKYKHSTYTRAVWKVHRLVAMSHCYAEGSGNCYAKLQ